MDLTNRQNRNNRKRPSPANESHSHVSGRPFQHLQTSITPSMCSSTADAGTLRVARQGSVGPEGDRTITKKQA